MKFNIKSILTLAMAAVLSASCSDNFLEEKKNYNQTDDSFYESQEQTGWYVNNLYYDFFSAYKSPTLNTTGLYNDTNSRLTEEIGGVYDLTNPQLTLVNSVDGSGYYGKSLSDKTQNDPYNRIRDCNSFLAEIDVKGADLDQTFRNRCKGQVYYLRALQYYDLMRVYGGVPIVTTVENAVSNDEAIKLPRASVTEVVNQIIADLDMAASLLPGKWDSTDYGRFTKGAALAQKSRVLLTYASPLFNKNWDSSTERWEKALAAGLAAENQLTADGYGLYGNSAKQWQDMFVIDNAFCPEAITVQLMGTGNTNVYLNNSWEKTIRLVSQGGTGALEAPKEMIDLFPMADGSKPTSANQYDPFLFFKNRDPRFYRTFAFSGMKWGYKENANSVAWSYRWLDASGKANFSDNNQENSPAYVRKMTNVAVTNANSYQYSGTDIFEYRYAELLLNIAECYAALGNTASTISYLGKIRNRVGIPSANNYGIGTLADKYAAIAACLYERQIELAYEGKRFYDVQRWMLYSDEAVNGVVNNTCAKLGLTPINGTKRTGHYLQYKNVATATDPLTAARASISVDPDSANFQTQLNTLAAFYTTNFVLADLVTPMDNVNKTEVTIKFNPNYYIMGLNSEALTQNPWLKQTIGWNDASNAQGIYNYQE
ncbi:RagB/SusD family nutrient uptake outer membrane protein [Flavobacterium agrisoli]|uniref:RagB/SusD family nutrient uptake outer membrane protein n=1 Tax=Flavobacterium agrisoli TaxID=2793066 RepID=A0A934PMF4_9FLAO|nr:RagB/SusD family nutrient uptake outer membrane protein [Flavobacterium agrisoli]MBK0370887.1 RagB/SusD family nutrient uptake outer membrane protein [Flavobacterium agrisoli]